MKNKISVAELNVSQASLLSGKTRETVSRAARELQSVNGERNEKVFDSRKLLQALYLGVTGPTYSEAQRLLTLERTAQIKLANEITRGKYYERDAVHFLYEHVFRITAATLKGNVNRVLTFEVVNEIFEEFRNSADDLRAKGDALWNEYEKEIQTKDGTNAGRIEKRSPRR